MKAENDLKTVFGLIHSKRYWFSAPSRSVNKVIEVYASSGKPKTAEEAREFIIQGVLTLKDENFYQRGRQWEMVTDIYGLIYDGHHWYVKLGVQDEETADGKTKEPWLQEISFHPPEKPFKTLGGIEIKTGV